MVSLVIVAPDEPAHLERCLAALAANTPYDLYEAVLVAIGSTEPITELLSRVEGDLKVVVTPAVLGRAQALNQAASEARGESLVFLDGRAVPQPGWLEALLAATGRDGRVAVAGGKVLSPDDAVWHAGLALAEGAPYPITPVPRHRGAAADSPEVDEERDVTAVAGTCMLVRAEVFRAAGGFDEEYREALEDVDLCLRLRAQGHRVVYSPRCVLYLSDPAEKDAPPREDFSYFHKRWVGKVEPDFPYRRAEPPAGRGEPAGSPPVGTGEDGRGTASVVIVTYNSLETIAPCLGSVLATLSPGDEVIVVDNASRDGTREYLEQVASRRGVRVILNERNLGFSRACNQGIAAGRGDLVVLLNPDTVVSAGWLARMAAHLREEGVGAVGPVSDYVAGLQKVQLYIDPAALRLTTPDGLAEIVYRRNRGIGRETRLLIGFCLMIPRPVLDRVGWLDEELFLGNDDLDLSWRLRRHGYRLLVATDVFVHHRGQASFRSEPEPRTGYLVQQSTNFLANKLRRIYGPDAVPSPEDLWGINWFAPTRGLTSIIIPCYNQFPYTRLCVESVLAHTPEPVELIFVDNGSSDGTPAYLEALAREHPRVKVVRNPENRGFAAACNQGLAVAGGDFLLLLNNDVIVTHGWLTRMLAATAIDRRIGLVGPRSNDVAGPQAVKEVPYGADLAAMHRFAAEFALQHAGEGHEQNFAIGFCLLITRAVVDRIGGFDTRYGLGNFEDSDYCLRARLAGFRVWICDDVFIHHFGSRTFRGARIDYKKLLAENEAKFLAKWGATKMPTSHLETWKATLRVKEELLYQPLTDAPPTPTVAGPGDERDWETSGRKARPARKR